MPSPALTIIDDNPRLVAVDKPAGLLSVPGKGADKQDCVAARVRAMFPAATGPLIVHRLDMETSGVMVLALDADAHRDLSAQFERREVQKRYEALLRGELADEQGVVSLRQRLDVDNRPIQIVDHVHGREAITRWRVLERGHDTHGVWTRVEFDPETGRTHQLRLAAATPPPIGLGAPILGDTLYRSVAGDAPRLMLHATMLTIRDPHTGESLTFRSPAPF